MIAWRPAYLVNGPYVVVALLSVAWVLAPAFNVDRLASIFAPTPATLLCSGLFGMVLLVMSVIGHWANKDAPYIRGWTGGQRPASLDGESIANLGKALAIGLLGAVALGANLVVISQYLPGREQKFDAVIDDARRAGNSKNPCALTLIVSTHAAHRPASFTFCEDALPKRLDLREGFPQPIEMTVRDTALGSVLVNANLIAAHDGR